MKTSHKKAAIRVIEQMPNNCTLEDIMYELYFTQKVEKGLKEIEEGKVVGHTEVKRGLRKWLRSSGH